MKKFFNNIWTYVAAIATFFLGWLMIERSRRKELESKSELHKTDKTDAVLAERNKQKAKEIKQEEKARDSIEKQKAKAKSRVDGESLSDLADFINKD